MINLKLLLCFFLLNKIVLLSNFQNVMMIVIMFNNIVKKIVFVFLVVETKTTFK